MKTPKHLIYCLFVLLILAPAHAALAASSLQTCYDHWKALEDSSRTQKARSGNSEQKTKYNLSAEYARMAASAISEAMTETTGQGPAKDSELYKRVEEKWPVYIEDGLPKDCRVIEGVGVFTDRSFMRSQRHEIDEALKTHNFAKVVLLAKIHADKGDAQSQVVLGNVYRNGGGEIRQDLAEAVKWFRLAADQGNAEAQMYLGQLQVHGAGMPKDAVEGVKLIQKAAEARNRQARLFMAEAYLTGTGVDRDPAESTRRIAKLAEQDDFEARAMLGERYAKGVGVPRDLLLAYMWLDIASPMASWWVDVLKQPKYATIPALRDKVAKALKPDELNKAKSWVAVCAQRLYRNCVDMDASVAMVK